eukprot:Plantae.Rhodophyta-Rhodochaete_pulchella.ctg45134.p1 GENE.Plantae.Rhodophyta-Rhodochaete_pulchella.ctg45134~~Plantae.Rhodophyta-Rhodochaete_pulchella.ctg45134.p1  ORF type:complete len:182 (+),score=16.98 Plantae.Rhodophyta-Rhodochaete_pulchella.ctg45134:333-878(+)
MEQAISDLALFFKVAGAKLMSLSGSHVDDIIQCAPPEERQVLIDRTKKGCELEATSHVPFTFAGLHIFSHGDGFVLSMTPYIQRLTELDTTPTFDGYRSAGARAAWVCCARPDVACAVSFAASATHQTFDSSQVKALNMIVRCLRSTADMRLCFRVWTTSDRSWWSTAIPRSTIGLTSTHR